jgi:MoaA/NifB/PqqE/SkfB family radical SAM enzyme
VATKYFINLDYVCNERCIFCAADVFNGKAAEFSVTLDSVRRWIADAGPGSRDRVLLAGGEPTLHPQLGPIVRLLAANCPDVRLFTNGLRLANPSFARSLLEARVSRFEIALFGASAARHDAITQVPGSFERTLLALNTLTALRREFDFVIEVRLLVSRHSSAQNPRIVHTVHDLALGVDAFSLNRLILSESAQRAEATISWEEASNSINESARLIRQFGFELVFSSLPLCVFEGDNAVFVRDQVALRRKRMAAGIEPSEWHLRYFDSRVAAERELKHNAPADLPLPYPCLDCDYLPVCGRVETWYLSRYGTGGLHTVRDSSQHESLASRVTV